MQGWNKFNHEFLWPLFHDTMADFQSTIPKSFDTDSWSKYQACNAFFARQLLPHVHENDIIWIHDYHMLTAATNIVRKLHRVNIGFYLHAPFPSVNSFMTIPVREELLTGMLASDLIGFQFFPYARNFFLAVKRILGLDPQYQPGGYMNLDCNGRQVHIKVAHFVYPFQDTKQVVDRAGVVAKTSEVTKLFPGRTLFAGMDRCDGLSGLVPKFRAFRRFLLSKPEYKGKVVLIQYVFDDWSNTKLLQTLQDLSDAVMETNELG
jgi:trehalose 6-phosphate synthase/phosphatase